MHILVCIKQVPAGSVPLDSTNGVLDRSLAGTDLNPFDTYAIEAALRLKETFGGSVTALTMGPPSAKSVLQTAFSIGVDGGVLLSDRAFAGADVFATARTLAAGIKTLSPFDYIVTGQQSTDGDTAQLPASLAVQLQLPFVPWVKAIEMETDNRLRLSQELSRGTQEILVSAPCLLSVGAGIGSVRLPNLRDKLRAKSKPIQLLTLADLQDTDATHYGLLASPTRVCHIETVEQAAKTAIQPTDVPQAVEALLHSLDTRGGNGHV